MEEAQQAQIADLEAKREDLERQLVITQDEQQAREVAGDEEKAVLALSCEQLETQIAEVRQTMAVLDKTKSDLEKELADEREARKGVEADLESRLAAVTEEKTQLDEQLAEQQGTIDALRSQMEDAESQLALFEADIAEKTARIDEVSDTAISIWQY